MPSNGTNSRTDGTERSCGEADPAPQSDPPRIVARLQNVSFAYEVRRAVEEISLAIPAGAFVSLLGPSGCGKTTLLKLLGGYLIPQQGRIELRGEDVTRREPNARNVGMVFQNYALFPHLSARRNVAFGLEVRGLSKPEIRERVEHVLDLVRLGTDERERRPAQLSGGQQQRVALARALAFGPDVLLLDEPLGSLDRHLRDQMREELRGLHRQSQVATLMVTHDQEEALSLSDYVGIINEGRLIQFGAPREVYNQPRTPFVARFLGEANLIPGEFLGRPANTLWMIRPEQIPLGGNWRGRVLNLSYFGSQVLATIQADPFHFKLRMPAHLSPEVGEEIAFDIPAENLWPIPEWNADSLGEGTV